MRKSTTLLFLLVFLLLAVKPVTAQAPTSYTSTINVTNVSETAGLIVLTYYDELGNSVDIIEEDIGKFETKWYTTLENLSPGSQGSLVISSSVPLASMSVVRGNTSTGQPISYAGYIGSSKGSTQVFLPLLMSKNYGYHTYFFVQNTSAAPVNVVINYSDGTTEEIIDLKPYASKKIDNKLEVHSAPYFSGKLTSSGGDILAAVVGYSDGKYGNQLYSYTGFTSQGATLPVFTIINQNNYGYWTGISLQNTGTVETEVTLQYTPSVAGTACTETQPIPAGEERLFGNYSFAYSPSLYPHRNELVTDCILKSRFVGTAAVIENTASQPLAGIINQLNNSIDPNKGGALMTQDPASVSDTVVFPYIQQWVGSWNWWTGWTVINVSDVALAPNDIECTINGSSPSGPFSTVLTNPDELSPGEGWYHFFYKNYSPLPNGFTGGAICTSQTLDGKLLGSMNILGAGAPKSVDSSATYEAINP